MRVYFSGIGGTAIGPLALIAKDLGYDVFGSDANKSSNTKKIEDAGIEVVITDGAENIEKTHSDSAIDWFIYTSALPEDHPELIFANENNIRTSKRSDFINEILKENNLKMIACAGTHGKTTTTAMMSWLFHKFRIPSAHSIGSPIAWGHNGMFQEGAEYFIYEADEYDRNFLGFKPYSSIIASVDFDHPDTYPTLNAYKEAFVDFIDSSHCPYLWRESAEYLNIGGHLPSCAHIYGAHENLEEFKMAGLHNRENAFLVAQCFKELFPEQSYGEIVENLNNFPGTARRFEKLSTNVYSDYAHLPKEISATLQMANEINNKVIAIYQPHQNVRQAQIMKSGGYKDAFKDAEAVYWMPTYLTREDPEIEVITPEKLVGSLTNTKNIQVITDRDELLKIVEDARSKNIVLFMGAGDIDDWARANFS